MTYGNHDFLHDVFGVEYNIRLQDNASVKSSVKSSTKPSDATRTKPSDAAPAKPSDASSQSDAALAKPSDAALAKPSDATLAKPSNAAPAKPSDAAPAKPSDVSSQSALSCPIASRPATASKTWEPPGLATAGSPPRFYGYQFKTDQSRRQLAKWLAKNRHLGAEPDTNFQHPSLKFVDRIETQIKSIVDRYKHTAIGPALETSTPWQWALKIDEYFTPSGRIFLQSNTPTIDGLKEVEKVHHSVQSPHRHFGVYGGLLEYKNKNVKKLHVGSGTGNIGGVMERVHRHMNQFHQTWAGYVGRFVTEGTLTSAASGLSLSRTTKRILRKGPALQSSQSLSSSLSMNLWRPLTRPTRTRTSLRSGLLLPRRV